MKNICPTCEKEPNSHSLIELEPQNGVKIFYTCPAKATKYWDKDGIIKHYEAVLSSKEEGPWVWVLDGTGFDIVHSLQVQVGIALTHLITEKYSKNLEKILVINPTVYINIMYSILYPFISNDIREIIKFV
jgi:hypothetical protein